MACKEGLDEIHELCWWFMLQVKLAMGNIWLGDQLVQRALRQEMPYGRLWRSDLLLGLIHLRLHGHGNPGAFPADLCLLQSMAFSNLAALCKVNLAIKKLHGCLAPGKNHLTGTHFMVVPCLLPFLVLLQDAV